MKDLKQFTRKEVSEWGSDRGTLFIIDNVVYDVTAFMDEHPGGHEVLAAERGRDASEPFSDAGHSGDAKELMQKYVVGEVVTAEREQSAAARRAPAGWAEPAPPPAQGSSFLSSWRFPALVGLLLTLLYSYLLP